MIHSFDQSLMDPSKKRKRKVYHLLKDFSLKVNENCLAMSTNSDYQQNIK